MKISVVIPTYNTNSERLDKLVSSIKNQTMDDNDYEIIFIDDGSTSLIFEKLKQYSLENKNIISHRISNSGWGSRPRNVALTVARGEFVLFMDHDDIIYPQAFEKVYNFGFENQLDVINPKEVRTGGWTWGWKEFSTNKISDNSIEDLLPMTPHKFYRTNFLLENDIKFPEGKRVLWEDVYFNVSCFEKKAKVGIFSDYPVYHWVDTGENNSNSYGSDPKIKWDEINKLVQFFQERLTGEPLEFMITHWYRTRVLGILGQWLQGKKLERILYEFGRAANFRETYVNDKILSRLSQNDRIRDFLLKEKRIDFLTEISNFEKGITARSYLGNVDFNENKLVLSASTNVTRNEKKIIEFVEVDGKFIKKYSSDILEYLIENKAEWLSSRTEENSYDLSVKGRDTRVTWQVKDNGDKYLVHMNQGLLKNTCEGELIANVNFGLYINDESDSQQAWDIAVRFNGFGLTSHRALAIAEDNLYKLAFIDGNTYVLYKNKSGLLSIDLNNSVKNFLNNDNLQLKEYIYENNTISIPVICDYSYGNEVLPVIATLDPQEETEATIHNFTEYEAMLSNNQGKLFLIIKAKDLKGIYRARVIMNGKSVSFNLNL